MKDNERDRVLKLWIRSEVILMCDWMSAVWVKHMIQWFLNAIHSGWD